MAFERDLVGSRVSKIFSIIPPRSDVARQDLLSTAITVEEPAQPAFNFEQDDATVGGSWSDSGDEFDAIYGNDTFQQEDEAEDSGISMESPESEEPSFRQEAQLAEKHATFAQMTRAAIRRKAPHTTRAREDAIVEKLWTKFLATSR